jgi:hypothetical protein
VAVHGAQSYRGTRERKIAYARAWKAANPDRRRAYQLKKYGLSLADYRAILDRQDGKCAICRDDLKGDKNTHVDHCHSTGVVRGVLCNRCNLAVGMLRNSSTIALAAARYLRGFL